MHDQIDDILKQRTEDRNILVAVDFDECVIEEHLSRRITEHFAHRAEILEENKFLHGSDAIKSLFAAYIGLTREEFESAVKGQVLGINWREGFLDMAEQLAQAPYFFVFVSSGIGDAIRIAATAAGLNNLAIIASEVKYDAQDVALGSQHVIADADKAEAVQKLMATGVFSKAITIGHGAGDVPLISSGTPGNRFALRDAEAAIAVADHVLESWGDLLQYL